MLPTPSTSHVCFDRVYEPAEDSFLLLDTLSSPAETAFLHSRFPPSSPAPLVLEVGVGSGVVLAFVAANSGALFGRRPLLALGTDVNAFASRAAEETANLALRERMAPRPGCKLLGVVTADLASSIRPGSVDVLIFNPPYVPTSEVPGHSPAMAASLPTPSQQSSHLLSLSYAGGVDGMEVTDRMLHQLPSTLHPRRGVAYLLLCAQNKPREVEARVRNWGPAWRAEIVGAKEKQAGWEKLYILRIWSISQD